MNSLRCPSCGLLQFDHQESCKRCGSDLFAAVPPMSLAAERSSAYAFQPVNGYTGQGGRSYSAGPEVVEVVEFEPTAPPLGGWLIVFIAVLILSVVLGLLGIKFLSDEMTRPHEGMPGLRYNDTTRKWSNFVIVLSGLQILICCFLLVRVWQKAAEFPREASWGLLSLLAINFLFYFSVLLLGNEKGFLDLQFQATHWVSVVTTGLWLGYFKFSQRVHTTFIK